MYSSMVFHKKDPPKPWCFYLPIAYKKPIFSWFFQKKNKKIQKYKKTSLFSPAGFTLYTVPFFFHKTFPKKNPLYAQWKYRFFLLKPALKPAGIKSKKSVFFLIFNILKFPKYPKLFTSSRNYSGSP